jgi:DNA-binding NtrC family response regulator
VESNPPHGTTFRVVLPASEKSTRDVATNDREADVAPMSVLVVDDEPSICRSLEILLGDVHHIETATRASDALARLATGVPFDMILCDLMMAEMTGMQFFEALSATRPELAQRVVFVTGGAFTPASREFLERVPNLRLEKPFDMRRLHETMRTIGSMSTKQTSS